jgi:hypothetical protein
MLIIIFKDSITLTSHWTIEFKTHKKSSFPFLEKVFVCLHFNDVPKKKELIIVLCLYIIQIKALVSQEKN